MGRGKDGKSKPSGMFEITEEERTAFDAMTDEEKQAYMEEKRAEREAERAAEQEKIDAMTDEEREAYLRNKGRKWAAACAAHRLTLHRGRQTPHNRCRAALHPQA